MHFLHFVFKIFDHLHDHYSEFFSRYFASFLFIYLDFCVSSLLLHLCSISLRFHFLFLTYCVWCLLFPGFKESLFLFLKKVELFLLFGFIPPKVGSVVCVSFLWGEICAEFCLLVFPLMGKAEWGGNPACWWLGLYFSFICCLDEASCTGCYWWQGDARSYVQVVLFLWVFTVWYSLELVLW